MILNVSLELPASVRAEGSRIDVLDTEVRDPAAGVIGHALGTARIHYRDGRRYLEITIEVDDTAAIAAATRDGAIF